MLRPNLDDLDCNLYVNKQKKRKDNNNSVFRLKCHFLKKAVLVNKKISQRKSFVGMFGKL